MSLDDIKQRIREFVSFDIETDYYDDEGKEQLSLIFRDILFEDNIVIRNLLERVFSDFESHARELDLIGVSKDVEVEPDETEEVEPDETEEVEPDETEGDDEVEDILDHKILDINNYLIEKANDFC
ncbi:MAG: hypothetical protein ACOC33_03650 [bacterium]